MGVICSTDSIRSYTNLNMDKDGGAAFGTPDDWKARYTACYIAAGVNN
jgi:hypothetical protein